jgi:hypothetical protein
LERPRAAALADRFRRLTGRENNAMEGSIRKVKGGSHHGTSKRLRGRVERPSIDWPGSANPRVGRNRWDLISQEDQRLVPWEHMYAASPYLRSLINEILKEVEAGELPCPTHDLDDLAYDPFFQSLRQRLVVWRDGSASPLTGWIPCVVELFHVVRLLHSLWLATDVDRRGLAGLGVGLAWRKVTGEFLGISPGSIETRYWGRDLLITNPQWSCPIRGEHVLCDGHAFAAELRKQGIEGDGAELDALLEAGLGDRLLAIAIPDPCEPEGGAA